MIFCLPKFSATNMNYWYKMEGRKEGREEGKKKTHDQRISSLTVFCLVLLLKRIQLISQ